MSDNFCLDAYSRVRYSVSSSRKMIDQRLAHLSEQELSALSDRYFAGDRVAVLVREFRLQCVPNQLYRLIPKRILHDRYCEACSAPLIQVRRAGSALKHTIEPESCSACRHRLKGHCRCDVCEKKRQQRNQAEVTWQRAEVEAYCKERWDYRDPQLSPDDLALNEAVSLLALVRCCGWVSDTSVGRIDTSGVPLAPEGPFGESVLATLLSSGLVAPALDSPTDAFLIEGGQIRVLPDRARWRILAQSPMQLVQRLERLCPASEWPCSWASDLTDFRVALAVAECREFADFCLAERCLPEAGHLATEALFTNLLTDFSVSQCFRIAWSGAMASIDFNARTKSSRRHAANYFIGACQRWADRARAEGWTVKPGFRNARRPRSQLSYVLNDVLLGIGEKGFSEPLGVSLK